MITEIATHGVDSSVSELPPSSSSSSSSPVAQSTSITTPVITSSSSSPNVIHESTQSAQNHLSSHQPESKEPTIKSNENNSSSSGPGTSAYSTPVSSSEKLDIPEETLRYQEKLVTECKTRMKNKFDSLEKEAGIELRRYWTEIANDSSSDLERGSGDEDNEDSSDNESNATKKKGRPLTSTIPISSIESVSNGPTKICEPAHGQTITNGPDSSVGCYNKSNDPSANETIRLLRKQLEKVQDELKAKDTEIAKLARIRSQVEYELEDLTASLFEEANKMVRSANVRQAKFERNYKEAMMKMSVLQAEVDALKVLVITSTPATPNKHLHSHLDPKPNANLKGESGSWRSRLSPFNHLPRIITKTNSNQTTPRKSPSNYELGGSLGLHYESNGITCDLETEILGLSSVGEVDPVFHQQFAEWRKNPSTEKTSSFISSIYETEIYPVFNFKNRSLTDSVLAAIEDNSIAIEAVSDKSAFPKKCALLDVPRTCKYRMKLGNDWYNISLLCRNRITAVCDLFCYLRYIQQGLVKSSFHDVYWEIMQRRKNIALSKLGLPA